jgi:hypothetical protein
MSREYYQANKERFKQTNAKYYQANKDKIIEKSNKYYQDNKEAILVKAKTRVRQYKKKEKKEKEPILAIIKQPFLKDYSFTLDNW